MSDQQPKAVFVHSVFAQIAKRYDLMNSVLSFQQHKLWRRFAMRKMVIPVGGHALDVATGTGDWALALADAVGQSGHVVGLDFVQEMLDVAEAKTTLKGYGRDRITFVRGDAMSLPFADNTFDVATIGFALRNVTDILTVLREMTRVVRPGGQVVSLELSKPTFAPFRAVYYFYFYRILPWIGALAVGKRAPYAWLPTSLTDFPGRIELESLFAQAGLVRIASYPLTGGIAALHVGHKVEASLPNEFS